MRNVKKTVITALLLSLALLASCAKASGGDYAVSYDDSDRNIALSKNESKIVAADGEELPEEENRKIIKTVDESVETLAYDTFMDDLTAAVKETGGYIASSRYNGAGYDRYDYNRYAKFVIRIPAENLDAFTEKIETIAAVTDYSENVTDITLAYVDLESRIAVLEAEEAALLTMLESAESVDTMLAIRRQLTDVQEDLAAYRAQMRSYDDKISYSTVTMSVYEVVKYTPTEEPGFFEEIAETFVDSLEGLGVFFRGLAVFFLGGAPYIIVFGGAIVLLIVLIRRGRKKREAKKKEKEDALR